MRIVYFHRGCAPISMWKMWKMWITLRIKLSATNKNLDFTGKMRYLWNLAVELCQVGYAQKNPHARHVWNVHKHVDNVDNYFPRRCSPMFTTSPAPIVINRSPCAQLFKRKLSISSKVGKYSQGVPSSWICFWRSWEEIPRSSVSRAA